jgi:hypothetical protein
MFLDNKLVFNTDWQTPQAVTTTADGTQLIDVTGAGSGNAPAMINGFPATNTSIGEDYGAADGPSVPWFYMVVTTAGTGAGTITVSLSAAPDNGSYSPGSYTQIYQSKAFTGSTLAAGSVLTFPVPPTLYTEGEALPRFYKVTYTVSGSATASVLAGFVLHPTTGTIGGKYANNFLAV